VETVTPPLLQFLRGHFALDWTGIHGSPHWTRVRENGLRLAASTGANVRVVEAFAFLHDSCRLNDDYDPDHGRRAAKLVRGLSGTLLTLSPEELVLLEIACEDHSHGKKTGDVTVCTCWDADRLDLGRVGTRPHASRLCTSAARDPALIEWAYRRSLGARAVEQPRPSGAAAAFELSLTPPP
jgi:uncharacterized protein